MKDDPSQWITSGLTCRQVTDRTTDSLAERLPLLTGVRLGGHLATCVDCRAYVKQMALIREALAGLPKIYPRAIDRLRLRRYFTLVHSQRR